MGKMTTAAVGEVTYRSPLSGTGHVQIGIRQNPCKEVWKSREDSFVNDAVKTHYYHYPRKIPIIPKYDPLYDGECAKYFTSPMVQKIIDITLLGKVSHSWSISVSTSFTISSIYMTTAKTMALQDRRSKRGKSGNGKIAKRYHPELYPLAIKQ